MMGTRRGAFLRGNHLHNGKVVGVGAESSPLVGTVSEVEGKSSYQTEDQYQGALRGRCVLEICSFPSCHLPISSAKQFTNNLSDVHSQYVPVNFAFENTAAESLRLYSANESCTIVSSQLAMIKKEGRLVRKLKFSPILTLQLHKLQQV